MINEIVLVLMLGYSPSGTTHVAMETLEYKQESMRACQKQAKRINKVNLGRFTDPQAFCVVQTKPQ